MNLREYILQANDLELSPLFVDEWQVTIYLRQPTVKELEHIVELSGKPNFAAQLAVLVCCDEQGNKLFTRADLDALAGKAGRALHRIVDAFNNMVRVVSDIDQQKKS